MNTIIKNGFLIVLCYLYVLVRGRSKQKIHSSLQRVLVIPASKLGDLICTTPVFHALNNTQQTCEVHVAAASLYRDLLAGNTDIDVFHNWDERKIRQNIRLIRFLNLDAIIITSPYFLAAATCFLAGVKMISVPRITGGLSPIQTRAYRAILPLLTVSPHEMGQYAPRQYLRLLEPLGIHSEDTTKNLAFSKQARERIIEKIRDAGFMQDTDFIVAISVTAGNKIKEWGIDKFAKVANWLSTNYDARIIFIGAKNDIGKVQETIDLLESRVKYFNTTGTLGFGDMKALISTVDLLVCVDSGPIYVAEAFGVPTVDIIGPINENEQPPISEKHIIVVAPNRSKPQLYVMNARIYNPIEARRQTEAISAEQVQESIAKLIKSLSIVK